MQEDPSEALLYSVPVKQRDVVEGGVGGSAIVVRERRSGGKLEEQQEEDEERHRSKIDEGRALFSS